MCIRDRLEGGSARTAHPPRAPVASRCEQQDAPARQSGVPGGDATRQPYAAALAGYHSCLATLWSALMAGTDSGCGRARRRPSGPALPRSDGWVGAVV
eukprot:521376-Rhodomonas_salina.2